jgi:hypothetical protein
VSAPAVRGAPLTWLRLEGAVLLAGAAGAYRWEGGSWALLAVAVLAPDLSMLGYLRRPVAGARCYNLAHASPLPACVLGAGVLGESRALICAGLIWLCHIGLDRLLGYGLKYPGGFSLTHLGGAAPDDAAGAL